MLPFILLTVTRKTIFMFFDFHSAIKPKVTKNKHKKYQRTVHNRRFIPASWVPWVDTFCFQSFSVFGIADVGLWTCNRFCYSMKYQYVSTEPGHHGRHRRTVSLIHDITRWQTHTYNPWWNLYSHPICLGSGPDRPKVQGCVLASDIHRKDRQFVGFLCSCCCPRQSSVSVMPVQPKKVCIVGSGNWWVDEHFCMYIDTHRSC